MIVEVVPSTRPGSNWSSTATSWVQGFTVGVDGGIVGPVMELSRIEAEREGFNGLMGIACYKDG
jgi:hypothetical protein